MTYPAILTRDFINPEFVFHSNGHSLNKDDLVDMIRFWKIFLWEKHGVRPGMKIGIAALAVDPYQITLIFAAAELGLSFVMLDHPVGEFALHSTKAALFAPIDIGVECDNFGNNPLDHKMIETFCNTVINIHDFDNYTIANPLLYDEIADTFFCKEDDVLVWTSTSGTTIPSRPVPYTHKYATMLGARNAKVFGHSSVSKVVHTRNMHHCSSFLIHFLPTIHACSHHWERYFDFNQPELALEFVHLLNDEQINFCMLINYFDLKNILKAAIENNIRFKHPLDINVSGFYIDSLLLEGAHKANLTITSTFGSSDTAVPLFINRISPHSSYNDIAPTLIGEFYDDGFYTLDLKDNIATIHCPSNWDKPRIIDDLIGLDNGKYYHLKRSNLIRMQNYDFNLDGFTRFIQKLLSNDDISVIVDTLEDKLYLAIWDDVPPSITHEQLIDYIKNSKFYPCIVDKMTNVRKKDFTVETKVNMDQLRGYFRSLNH